MEEDRRVIHIRNLEYGASVTYSLALLEGWIEAAEPGTVVGKDGVLVWNETRDDDRIDWPVKGDRFVALVQLTHGENRINLVYGCCSAKFLLVYRPAQRKHYVRPIYIVCNDDDGRFQAPNDVINTVQHAQKRIVLGAKLIQTFTAEKLHEQGLGRRTFLLEGELNGEPNCQIFKSSLKLSEAHSMTCNELWTYFANEFTNSSMPDRDTCKWYAFMSFTRYNLPTDHQEVKTHGDVLRYTKGHAALGGGGLALFGTGNLHTWAESLSDLTRALKDDRKIDKTKLMDDSAYRQFYWANYSTGLGASLHELGHTFHLAHTSHGIMARGFDDLYRVFLIDPWIPPPKSRPATPNNVVVKRPQSPQLNTLPRRHQIAARVRHNSEPPVLESDDVQSSGPRAYKLPAATPINTEDSKSLSSSLSQVSLLSCRLEGVTPTTKHGGAYWARSSAVLLAYSKWFNDDYDDAEADEKPTINRGVIASKHGIRLIELRNIPAGLVFHHWEFLEPEAPRSYKLHARDIRRLTNSTLLMTVLVEDDRGHVIRKKITVTNAEID